MPRHPPNALLTLDRSHCQCSSLAVVPKGRGGKGYLLQPNPNQMPSTCSTRSSTLNPAKSWILRKGLSAIIWNYAEQFRGRVLRPASRDLSGDARSGNINPAEPSDEGRTFEQRSASGQADPVDQHPDISSLHNVSRTGISLSRDDANLFFPQGYPQASTPIEWWS